MNDDFMDYDTEDSMEMISFNSYNNNNLVDPYGMDSLDNFTQESWDINDYPPEINTDGESLKFGLASEEPTGFPTSDPAIFTSINETEGDETLFDVPDDMNEDRFGISTNDFPHIDQEISDDQNSEDQDEIAAAFIELAKSEDTWLDGTLLNPFDNPDDDLTDIEENDQVSSLPESWVPSGQFERYEQINDAYDAIQQELQKQDGLVAQVKFFQAAEDVTGWGQLRGLEFLNSSGVISDNALEYMRGLSTHLYNQVNLPHAQSLLQVQDGLPSPANDGTTFNSALEHDLRMVEIEQAAVEAHLREAFESGKINQSDIDTYNSLINNNFLASYNDWAEKALERELSILNLEDREALGKAMIYQLHGKSEADFLGYMRSQK